MLFLLAINEVLLAPPAVKDDVSDQLCERVLSVLFEVWLIACVRNFPSPSLWKTMQESCLLLRHRIALIEQWNRVNLALTARLLEFLYGPSFPELKIRKFKINISKIKFFKKIFIFSGRGCAANTDWYDKRLHRTDMVSFFTNDWFTDYIMFATNYQ